jgi:hypothetical protein
VVGELECGFGHGQARTIIAHVNCCAGRSTSPAYHCRPRLLLHRPRAGSALGIGREAGLHAGQTQARIEVSGPSAGTVQDISGGRLALESITNDQFGVREQREIGLVHVPTAGRYTLHVLINASYYGKRGERIRRGSPKAGRDPSRSASRAAPSRLLKQATHP